MLGIVYQSLAEFSQAIKYHTQAMAIAKEVGDRTGEGRAYAHLGIAHGSLGGYAKSIEYQTQHLVMMMMILLLFLQKHNLASAIYLFGLGTLL
jgi:tetratricopeptide (TPR) repeat protein